MGLLFINAITLAQVMENYNTGVYFFRRFVFCFFEISCYQYIDF
jgi:hypothetical protein